MIELTNVYRCICEKCKSEWNAKDAIIPATCAKCRSTKWNTQSEPTSQTLTERVKQLSTAKRLELFEHFELCCGMDRGACICDVRPAETVKPIQTIQPEPENDLTAFIAKAQASKGITSELKTETETVNEWTGWTDPGQIYDDQTGEMRTFRKHIKTGKVKWVDNESYQMGV